MNVNFSETYRTDTLALIIGEESSMELSCSTLLVNGFDWDMYLSPWPSPRVFKKGNDFAGKADELVEEIEKRLFQCHAYKRVIACGYSLAGLFAMYYATKSDHIDSVMSASGSMWFPGFRKYLEEHPIKAHHVYMSLGDKEKNAKNPLMATVEDETLRIKEMTNAFFEMNEGNHFKDADIRMRKGVDYLLSLD